MADERVEAEADLEQISSKGLTHHLKIEEDKMVKHFKAFNSWGIRS